MRILADSNITKRAFAFAMKELLKEEAFSKISVADICNRCEMSRKSFYYHFKDKYDLVNWIFDSEFLAAMEKKDETSITEKDKLEAFFFYLYENREFYCKVLPINGQNSISEHFREQLHPILHAQLCEILGGKEVKTFYIDLLTDIFLCSIMRWLLTNENLTPREFLSLLNEVFKITSVVANTK